ncbi:Phosphonoacetaldehyde hydrolase [Hartmannibacter diazotrophicus]|uniref:Phosphonoacetaldehyde hydrolase n=1 Tax=Hartmannibacter diazotrophicus TaxID=1482074 RepID=A0A2C9DB48_9HYPH|nr:phosphonoacetaldehyde hydrolase [Hartmannibacter diazotrophicus]SON56825.1 Phosphonoacetaldehyde hydrolase [Hartmannibacter diazotrophicus]
MTRFKAVVFDWAGTTIDFGSFAPMGVFVEAFAKFGIEVTIAEARGPMGKPKWDHIKTMMTEPAIASAWAAKYGSAPTDADVDKVYEVFVPMNEEVVANFATLVPGTREAIEALRAMGMKIGSTTGYTRSIMERVLPVAAEQGYVPDNLVCADDLAEGRPGPLGMYKCFIDLVVYPPSAVIKVDDTEPGIAEGVAAGCVTVGVALSGNECGHTPEELAAMDPLEVAAIRERVTAKLKAAGADHIIDTVADLPALVQKLETE